MVSHSHGLMVLRFDLDIFITDVINDTDNVAVAVREAFMSVSSACQQHSDTV